MSILKLLGKHTFDVDTTKTLASAFDAAWLSLQTSGSPFAADNRAAATRELLAERLIEIAHRGERDRQRLVDEGWLNFQIQTETMRGAKKDDSRRICIRTTKDRVRMKY